MNILFLGKREQERESYREEIGSKENAPHKVPAFFEGSAKTHGRVVETY